MAQNIFRDFWRERFLMLNGELRIVNYEGGIVKG